MQGKGPVGVVGLGLVGTAVVHTLRQAAWDVVGYDVRAEAGAALCAPGFRAAATLTEVAAACRVILLCLPTSEIVAEVVEGPDGLHAALGPGDVLLDMTTGAPAAMAAMAERLAVRQVHYLDVTLGGNSEELRTGRALLMVGGEQDAFRRAGAFLDALSDKVFRMGPPGSGARAKLVYNLVLGLHRAVLAEGLTLGRHVGLEPERLLAVLRAGTTYSYVMDNKGDKMLRREYTPPVAKLAQHLKDVRLILDMGHSAGAPLPLSALHAQLLQIGVGAGMGEWDNASVFEVYARLGADAGPGQ